MSALRMGLLNPPMHHCRTAFSVEISASHGSGLEVARSARAGQSEERSKGKIQGQLVSNATLCQTEPSSSRSRRQRRIVVNHCSDRRWKGRWSSAPARTTWRPTPSQWTEADGLGGRKVTSHFRHFSCTCGRNRSQSPGRRYRMGSQQPARETSPSLSKLL